MRKHLLFFVFISFASFVFAGQSGIKSKRTNQQYFKHDILLGLKTLAGTVSGKVEVEWNHENSTPSFISGKLTASGYSVSANKADDGIRFLSSNKELFGISNPAQELSIKSSITDELLMTHVKYDQMINSIKIFPSQLIVHFNADGSIESVNGNYVPTPIINTVPKISGSSAIVSAKQALGNYTFTSESFELILYRNNLNLTLAYEIKLPSNACPEMKLIIDANSGMVLYRDSGIRYDGPMVGSGVGLNGNVKSINTYLSGGKYYLINASLPMFVSPIDSLKGVIVTNDAQNDTNNGGYNSVIFVTDPNNDNNFNDNERLKAAVDAHSFVQVVYKYYKSYYNRNSYNDKGGSLINVVHYINNYNNAFWNGTCMSYGDGDGIKFSNLAGALDVIAHELTHGVTGSTANLIYHNQSGAINESISDCFACCVDSTNWLIGEDVYTPGIPGDALRNMMDPHNGAAQGSEKWQPSNMSEYLNLPDTDPGDWGGVHINSGIPNKAFYNVASVTGHYKAGKIWYRALTAYLTNNSQFSDLRTACQSAAKDIFGATSSEYTTVTNAFDAVGITGSTGVTTDLIYDDGDPGYFLWGNKANEQLAVRFTPTTNNVNVQNVKIYIGGDGNNGTGHFSLVIYAINNSALPGTTLLSPFSYTPSVTGWQSFDLSNTHITNDFFVSVIYDGVNYAAIGADVPPGNGRSYIYDPSTSSWSKLVSPNDYTLFMRATIKTITSVAEIDTRVPEKFELTPNYPNPFNPTTTIRYSLPEAANVKITIFDVNGNHITDLADNHQNPGTYTVTWNGKNDSGISVSSGVYYCRVMAGNYAKTNKMILMK
jgi:bacillolysin/thermolysin